MKAQQTGIKFRYQKNQLILLSVIWTTNYVNFPRLLRELETQGLIWLSWIHKTLTRPFNFHSIMPAKESHHSLVIVHNGRTRLNRGRRIWSLSVASESSKKSSHTFYHHREHTIKGVWLGMLIHSRFSIIYELHLNSSYLNLGQPCILNLAYFAFFVSFWWIFFWIIISLSHHYRITSAASSLYTYLYQDWD